jgi:hypothetical protein
MSTLHCSLYCKFGAKYSAHPPDYSMWTVDPTIYNTIAAPLTQASILSWSYLCCCYWYSHISMPVMLQAWCQIWRTSSGLRYVNCGPCHIQCSYSSEYSGSNIQLQVSALLFEISRQFNARSTATMVPNTAHIIQFTLSVLCSGHIQCNNSMACSGFNIQLYVSALLLDISWKCNVRYTANLMPNIAHILQFTLFELWSRTYAMQLQVRLFRLQYSAERICAAIGGIPKFRCPSYCKYGAKFSTHPPVYAKWTEVPTIYNVITAPHIQASIFNWTYLRFYRQCLDNSMRVIL